MTEPDLFQPTIPTADSAEPPAGAVAAELRDPVRLAALRATGLVDSAPEEGYDRLTRLANRVLGTPIALVSVLDAERQFFKSIAAPSGGGPRDRATPTADSFCQHVVRTGQPLLIPDTRHHPWTRDLPTVRAGRVLAYAGVPLVDDAGQVLGTFCVMDNAPRRWTPDQVATLAELADLAGDQIRLRAAVRSLGQSEREQHFLADAGTALASSLELGEILDAIAGLATARVADYCLIDLVAEEGGFRRAAMRHADPERQAWLCDVQAYPADPASMPGLDEALRTGSARWVRRADEAWQRAAAHDDAHFRAMQRLGVDSLILAPMVARERLVGVILLACTTPATSFGPRDVALADELARRAALAVDNARLYEQARQAVRARDEVLAVVSHDLRNPVGTAQMGASLLLDMAPPDDPSRRTLEIIQRSMRQANRLIGDLLDVTRIEAGRLTVEVVTDDPGEVLDEVCQLMSPAATAAGIALERTVEPGVPPICGDRARLVQALGNLVGNALKFTPRGGTVRLGAEIDPDGGVRLSVADTGAGIPAEAMPRLWDRFWQANRADRRGAGLGLAIFKGIAEAHGGAVGADSRPGEGSCFWMRIPAAEG